MEMTGKTAKEIVEHFIGVTGIRQKEIAQKMGFSQQNLSLKISRGNFRADDFIDMLQACGVTIEYILTATEKEEEHDDDGRRKGHGKPCKQVIDGVEYDTETSNAIANTFYQDGVNEYKDESARELYKTDDGKFFIVVYHAWRASKPSIVPVTAEFAEHFAVQFGTNIEKKPAE